MRKFINFGLNKKITIGCYKAKDEFSIGLDLRNDFEQTIQFNLSLPFLFKFYLSFDTPLCKTKWWQKFLLLDEPHKYSGREFGIKFISDEVAWGKDYYFSVNFGSYIWETPSGWTLFKSLTDVVYGKYSYTNETYETWNKTVFIPGTYGYNDGYFDLSIKRKVANWKWERFNKTFTSTYFEVECETGVPYRFRWGTVCGLNSKSFDVISPDEAIEKFINLIHKERSKNY